MKCESRIIIFDVQGVENFAYFASFLRKLLEDILPPVTQNKPRQKRTGNLAIEATTKVR